MNAMHDVTAKADYCKIFNKLDELHSLTVVATSECVLSNGKFESHVNSDGYIAISNISGEYLVFNGVNGVWIYLYKFASDEALAKALIDIDTIRREIDDDPNNDNEDDEPRTKSNTVIHDDLIDINTFKCINCSGAIKFTKNADIIIGTCKICATQYTLTPSRYYVISAIKKLYNSKHDRSVSFE